ncbi:MAG: caspase family protein [Alphaproteobacteria bacterium]|nr:caspase family protein [Alphaproteobacteria bacterium]
MIPMSTLFLALLSAPRAEDLTLRFQRGVTTTEDLRVVELSDHRRLTLTSGEAILWEADTGRELLRTGALSTGDAWVQWSVQPEQLVGLRSDGVVHRYDPHTLRILPTPAAEQAPNRCPKPGNKEDLEWTGGLSPDGAWAFCANSAEGFRLLDIEAGGEWLTFPAEPNSQVSKARLALDAAGAPVLVYPSKRGLVRHEVLSDARTLREERAADWSPPGPAIFVKTDDGCALWRWAEDSAQPVPEGLCQPVARHAVDEGAVVLALLPEAGAGSRAVALDTQRAALLWEDPGVEELRVTPDGRQVFLREAGTREETWTLREVRSGREVQGLEVEQVGDKDKDHLPRTGAAEAAWWSEDGQHLRVALGAQESFEEEEGRRSVFSLDLATSKGGLAYPPGRPTRGVEPAGDGALLLHDPRRERTSGWSLWSGAPGEAPTTLDDCGQEGVLREVRVAGGHPVARFAQAEGPDPLVDLQSCERLAEGVTPAPLADRSDRLLALSADHVLWAPAGQAQVCSAPLRGGGQAHCVEAEREVERLVDPVLGADGALIAVTRPASGGGGELPGDDLSFNVLQNDRAEILELDLELELSRWDGGRWERLDGVPSTLVTLHPSPDGRLLAVLDRGEPQLRDARSGALRLTLDTRSAEGLSFSPDGRVVATTHASEGVKLWSTQDGALIATLVVFLDGSWAALDPQSRFERSVDGVEGLHFVYVDDAGAPESIGLDQLEHYYEEPRLLTKLLNPELEPREVVGFDLSRLPPRLSWTREGEQLQVSLEPRGGGVGRVALFLNGQEVAADVRPAEEARRFTVDLGPYQRATVGEGRDRWALQAWSADERVASRGAGTLGLDLLREADEADEIDLFAVVVGTHEYEDAQLDLRYADDDALAMAAALEAGGVAMLGSRERVHVTLLSTAAGQTRPSGEALSAAFAEIAANADPWDLLVVYFSGHGVSREGVYYYPWPEATSEDLALPATLEARALSHLELMDLIRGVPAQKRLLVLDTCEAGWAPEGGRSSLAADAQARSLQELKRRMGMTILAGAPAQKSAYEHPALGHGLLTYALLDGLRGAALHQGRLWEVGRLAQYVTEAVPRIAEELDEVAVQEPVLRAPEESVSWWFGARPEDVDAQIPLRSLDRPRMNGGQLVDFEAGYDRLHLSEATSRALFELETAFPVGYRWAPGSEAPESWRLGGLYREDGPLDLTLVSPEGQRWQVQVSGEAEGWAECAALWTNRVFEHAAGRLEAPPPTVDVAACEAL